MIGWYVHHHGSGHLNRAGTVARELALRGEEVVGLSSLPRPDGWPGRWLRLDRDDLGPAGTAAPDPTAGGRLHWAPLGDPGLASRTARIAAWLEREAPRLVVVDQSVEICLLARLHGVRVVGVTAPGRRDDAPHLLGFDVCDDLVGAWPAGWTDRLLPTTPAPVRHRFRPVGAVARFAPAPAPAPGRDVRRRRPGPPRVALLGGTGGADVATAQLAAARRGTPGWEWTVLSAALGSWHPDPFAVLLDADVVVTHAGQNSLAEVAASRTPAVVLPEPRPFDEQVVTAAALAAPGSALPVVAPGTVVDPTTDWVGLLERARGLDGARWEAWCDGGAAARFADLLTAEAGARVA